jgi:hypothetical protein
MELTALLHHFQYLLGMVAVVVVLVLVHYLRIFLVWETVVVLAVVAVTQPQPHLKQVERKTHPLHRLDLKVVVAEVPDLLLLVVAVVVLLKLELMLQTLILLLVVKVVTDSLQT